MFTKDLSLVEGNVEPSHTSKEISAQNWEISNFIFVALQNHNNATWTHFSLTQRGGEKELMNRRSIYLYTENGV